jgi:hypothetical protein
MRSGHRGRSGRLFRSVIGAGVAALAVATSSCAMIHSARIGKPGLEVVVGNDVRPARDVVVFLEQPNGSRVRLGTVESDSTRVLRYGHKVDQGDYQLVAQDAAGVDVVSQRVSLGANEQRVVWQPGARNASTSIVR